MVTFNGCLFKYFICRLYLRLDKDSSHAGMKAIAILIQLSKCWDFLWDFRFNDVIPRSCDQIFFQSQIFSVKHVPYHNKYIFMYWLYIQKIIVSWIMPDEAKKLNFFNTKVDHVMHKLPADYVINLGYTNQNRLLDLQRPSFVPSFMDN